MFAGLVGGIVWNLLTWLLGIPSSSSHALIGGIVGAMIAAVGGHGVIWSGVVSKVIIPAVVAAVIAVLVGAVDTWLVYRATRGVPEKRTNQGFRRGQIGSAALVSLAHGTNDAQKTMGVIFLGPISYGAVSKTAALPPLWVIVSCAVAMGAGTYVGVPLAGAVGAVTYALVHTIGSYLGVGVGFVLLAAASLAIWLRSRKVRIDHTNVNAEWEGNLTAGLNATAEPDTIAPQLAADVTRGVSTP